MGPFLTGLLNVLIVIASLFLICLVLIQRGKGGGLAGAFGGMGGSSAFGTKAGDVFTKITIITASVWFVLAMLLVLIVNSSGRNSAYDLGPKRSANEIPVPPATGGANPAPAPGKGDAKTGGSTLPAGTLPTGSLPAGESIPTEPAPTPK